MQEIAWSHMVGYATVSVVIRETTEIIWDVLKGTYVAPPTGLFWMIVVEVGVKTECKIYGCRST
jgi:hypothetical protein